jgi:hypothetical protein
MPNADMTRLMDQARIRLPGAVDGAILVELFAVMKEFFAESNLWREDIQFPVIATTANRYTDPAAFTYSITPSQGAINRLMVVRNGDGYPVHATMEIPGEIVLSTSPNSDSTYTATVALTVSDPVTSDGYPEFPDWVMNKYLNDLLDGVLGRMMSQIAKPYSSPSIALVHLRKFKQSIGRAKVEANRRNVYRAPTWRFPRGFAN